MSAPPPGSRRRPAATLALVFAAVAMLLALAPAPARAVEIQRVVSPGGIEAWLVEDHTVPLISLRFAFRGGAANDPDSKPGLANMLSGMLDEGAGELDSQAFQRRLHELAIRMSFSAGRDWFRGNMQTLSENRDKAFGLLRLALTEPRFDREPLERIRQQILVGLRRDQQDPEYVASRAWMRIAFKNHIYARPQKGTPETIGKITRTDLKDFTARLFRTDGLLVAAVGDIDAETLARLLDETFGPLPAPRALPPVPEADVANGPTLEIIRMDIPQTVIQFGARGLKRDDEDYIPAYILNGILGGGGFSSRLYEEIREKRGLAYSVFSYLHPFEKAGLFLGGAATQNNNVAEAISLIRREIRRLAEEGPTAEELEDAKTYLTGSYALRFDTGSKIAGQLLGIQMADLGIDYIDRRNDLIRAVTLDDVKRVARRFLDADRLIITLVGKPAGVRAQKTGG